MKKLTVAVAVDDEGGMLFYGKRLSKDSVLTAEFIESAAEAPVYASDFSRILFAKYPKVKLCENPFEDAEDRAYCFIENYHLAPYLDMIDTIIIYRWNRFYNSDFKLDIDPQKCGYICSKITEFSGSSHDKITKEVYENVRRKERACGQKS